jgi:hypothetical protein
MPSTIGTLVTANYLKAQASTQFGTRQLSVLNIAAVDVANGYADSDSLFSKAVRALQQTAEIWAVFTPVDGAPDSFNVVISTDSQWAGNSAHQGAVNGGNLPTQGYGVLETALTAGTDGSTTFTVTAVGGCAAPFHG